MSRILSIISLLNGAVWLGTNFFMMFAVASFFRGESTMGLLGAVWSETILVALYRHYFVVNAVCAILALALQTGEWIYLARHVTRRSTYLIIFCVILGLLGLVWVYPTFRSFREAANLEQAQLTQQSAGDTSSAADSTPSAKGSKQLPQTKYYDFWRQVVRVYHFFFLVFSAFWMTRQGRSAPSTRPFLY